MGYMDNDKITQLKDLLEEAKIQIKAFSLPGLEFGRCVFENNPIIETDALRELEKNYAIEIPADYKLYLTKIGNGGSQPLCGMFSVEESLALNRLSDKQSKALAGDRTMTSVFEVIKVGDWTFNSNPPLSLQDFFFFCKFLKQHLFLKS